MSRCQSISLCGVAWPAAKDMAAQGRSHASRFHSAAMPHRPQARDTGARRAAGRRRRLFLPHDNLRWNAHNSSMSKHPPRGALVVISGPSGAGKTSICDELLKRIPNSCWSVSVTTRPRRGQEVDGQAYRFVTCDEFTRMAAAGELLEQAQYLGNWYGTPRQPVDDAVANGRIVIMEIDVQGGAQIAQRVPESIRVFVLPPTMETLKARLEGRQTETETIQAKRIAQADGEIAFARSSGYYPYFITNDILEDSVREVMAIIDREAARA